MHCGGSFSRHEWENQILRIAVLADIHGNLPAFEAALDHVATQRVDQIVIAGDVVVGSPDSAACWRLATSLGCPIVRGNHERYVAHYGGPAARSEWATERYAPVRWAAAQFAEDERRAIERLPLAANSPDWPDLLIVHASLRNDRDTVAPHTPDAELDAMFPDVGKAVIVRAHNHVAQLRLWRERVVVTCGSVGLPLDGSTDAKYAILERHAGGWRVEHHAAPYDVMATLRRFHETGYLDATGVMGRLFMREVATASFQVVPFLTAYGRWSAAGGLPLDVALERFLSVSMD
jgi:predicted phosphodiesterase